MIRINAMGEACPLPVVKTLRALQSLGGAGSVETLVVVISADHMGEGNEELGRALLKAFLFALTQQETLPAAILFYNAGAAVTCEGSASLEDLQALQSQGVEILTCGTCLNYYGLTEKLRVGEVTNMYVIAEKQLQADCIIRP